MAFWTYILRCADGSYYVGHTDDLEKRLSEHECGEATVYTRKRRPIALVWSDMFGTRDEAFAAERQLKGWSRAKKEALIKGNWGGCRRWHDICDSVWRHTVAIARSVFDSSDFAGVGLGPSIPQDERVSFTGTTTRRL